MQCQPFPILDASFHVCSGVAMRSAHLCMPEPCLNCQKVYVRLQKGHRRRVPEYIRRTRCCDYISPHNVGGAEPSQALSVCADKYRHVFVMTDVTLS